MINQIYHTSHCGSTLLISLLRKSIKSYSEPFWSHQVIRNEANFFDNIYNYQNDEVIKLPSGLCHFSHQTEGKKIFLYRQLKQHLLKIFSGYNLEYIDFYYQYFQNNMHPSLKNIQFNTIEKQNIFLWANRIMWMSECTNSVWIESNKFLSNKKKFLDVICDYFQISKVIDIDLSNIDVKSIGMHHNDCDLNKVIPNFDNLVYVNSEYGIILDEECFNDNRVYHSLEWAYKNLTFIPKFLF